MFLSSKGTLQVICLQNALFFSICSGYLKSFSEVRLSRWCHFCPATRWQYGTQEINVSLLRHFIFSVLT